MATLEASTLPMVQKALHTPRLEEVAEVLSRGLRDAFERVSVEVAPCPDLRQPPYHLEAAGLCGGAQLIELGGPPYLLPCVRRDKLYDLKALLARLGRDPAFLAGAGAGPWPHLGRNCEGVVNLSVREGAVRQGSRIVSVQDDGPGYVVQRLPADETRGALLGNFLVSDGAPGRVLKVLAERRLGETDFVTAVRRTLAAHFGDRVVGLGGVFVLRSGRARHHVMPDFSETPIRTERELNEWLRFFEMRAPLTHVGTLVTGDLGLDLRAQHFHGWGEHGDGGHYHCDTTADSASYEAYFVLADSVLRVDAPQDTHMLGRD